MLSIYRKIPQFYTLGTRCVPQPNGGAKPVQLVQYQKVATAATSSKISDSASMVVAEEEEDKLYRMIEVEVRGNDKAVLKSYTTFATSAADHLGIQIGKCWTPSKAHHERYTLLRSIHVNKKNLVQYEFRTYFWFMQFHRLTGSTADTFLEYIQRNLPEGVAMKVAKVALEKLPDHLKPQAYQKEMHSTPQTSAPSN